MRLDRDTLRALGLATQLGFAVAGPLVLGIAGGIWLDHELGTSPLFLLLGLVLGMGAAAYSIYELVLFRSGGTKNGGKS